MDFMPQGRLSCERGGYASLLFKGFKSWILVLLSGVSRTEYHHFQSSRNCLGLHWLHAKQQPMLSCCVNYLQLSFTLMSSVGLDVDTCHIIEMACLITDENLNIVAEVKRIRVVKTFSSINLLLKNGHPQVILSVRNKQF